VHKLLAFDAEGFLKSLESFANPHSLLPSLEAIGRMAVYKLATTAVLACFAEPVKTGAKQEVLTAKSRMLRALQDQPDFNSKLQLAQKLILSVSRAIAGYFGMLVRLENSTEKQRLRAGIADGSLGKLKEPLVGITSLIFALLRELIQDAQESKLLS